MCVFNDIAKENKRWFRTVSFIFINFHLYEMKHATLEFKTNAYSPLLYYCNRSSSAIVHSN